MQLPLALSIQPSASFENFHAGKNHEVVTFLLSCSTGESNINSVYLWGEKAIGKTHLLHALCLQFDQQDQRAAYIPLQDHAELAPSMLDGLEMYALICIDDLHAIAGNASWENALFHLYNRIDGQRALLVVTGKQSLDHIDLQLADLKSCLTGRHVYQLSELDDTEKALALQKRAKERGLELLSQVSKYLLSRYPGDLTDLLVLLDDLDKASLAEQRKLTIPFIKYWLNERERKD